MRGCAEFMALLGMLALLLGGVLMLSSLSGPDCSGFQCIGREVGVFLGAVVVVGSLILLIVGSATLRRRR